MKHNPNLRFSGCGPPLIIAMVILSLACIAGVALRPIAFWYLHQYHGIDPYTNAHYLSEPYIHEDKIYFGAGECFYQLQLDGTVLREIVCKDWLFESPVGDDKYVYAQLNSNLIAISLETGKIAWRAHTPFANAERQFARTETQLFLVNDTVVSWRSSGISVYSTRTRKTIGHYRNWAINSVWVYDDRLWLAANPASEWSSFETFLKVLREEPTSPSSYPRHANTIMVMALDTGQVQPLIDAAALGVNAEQSIAIIGLDAAQISIRAISTLPGSDRELRVAHHQPIVESDLETPAYPLQAPEPQLQASHLICAEEIMARLESGERLWLVHGELVAFIYDTEFIRTYHCGTGELLWEVQVDSVYEIKP